MNRDQKRNERYQRNYPDAASEETPAPRRRRSQAARMRDEQAQQPQQRATQAQDASRYYSAEEEEGAFASGTRSSRPAARYERSWSVGGNEATSTPYAKPASGHARLEMLLPKRPRVAVAKIKRDLFTKMSSRRRNVRRAGGSLRPVPANTTRSLRILTKRTIRRKTMMTTTAAGRAGIHGCSLWCSYWCCLAGDVLFCAPFRHHHSAGD